MDQGKYVEKLKMFFLFLSKKQIIDNSQEYPILEFKIGIFTDRQPVFSDISLTDVQSPFTRNFGRLQHVAVPGFIFPSTFWLSGIVSNFAFSTDFNTPSIRLVISRPYQEQTHFFNVVSQAHMLYF
jgi:hypothetical protein